MAKQKKRVQAQAKRTGLGTALAEPKRKVEDLAELSEEGQALAFEIAANRQAILKLGGLVLDHERRISALEDTLTDLAGEVGEDEDVIELEPAESEPKRRGRAGVGKAQAQAQAETSEAEDEAEAAARFLGLPALFGSAPSKAKGKGRGRKRAKANA